MLAMYGIRRGPGQPTLQQFIGLQNSTQATAWALPNALVRARCTQEEEEECVCVCVCAHVCMCVHACVCVCMCSRIPYLPGVSLCGEYAEHDGLRSHPPQGQLGRTIETIAVIVVHCPCQTKISQLNTETFSHCEKTQMQHRKG